MYVIGSPLVMAGWGADKPLIQIASVDSWKQTNSYHIQLNTFCAHEKTNSGIGVKQRHRPALPATQSNQSLCCSHDHTQNRLWSDLVDSQASNILKIKIRSNDWLLGDTCLQAANHCALFRVWEWTQVFLTQASRKECIIEIYFSYVSTKTMRRFFWAPKTYV